MQKFHFPLRIPDDRILTLTQGFGKTENALEPGGPHGELHYHYGIDVVDGLPAETYGTPIICPFKEAHFEGYLFDGPSSQKTNYIKFSGTGASGNKYTLIFAHISAMFFKEKYVEGDVLGLVGNAGMVAPRPTPGNPFGGSHLHFGVQIGGEWVNPLDYFDIANPYRGPQHPAADGLPRIQWALEILKEEFNKVKAYLT